MQVTTALLADAAQVQNGKLYVLGGGFDTVRTRALPALHKQVAVVLVVQIGSEERHTDLELKVSLVDEDMGQVGPEASGTLRVGAPPSLRPGQTSLVPLAISFHDLRLPEAKGYVFLVTQGERELARIPFWVVVTPAQ